LGAISLHATPRILVTGGAGFIGSAVVRRLLGRYGDVRVLNLDKLTYAGNLANLAAVEADPRYAFVRGDVAEGADVVRAFDACEEALGAPADAVVHVAAETHVDRSIEDPALFLRTNALGTELVLRQARARGVRRALIVSTDEVYGALRPGDAAFTEDSPLAPNNPYAASKAAGDLMARAYHHTYGFDVVITRCANNYGPYQFPEKLIPLMIANALDDRPLPVYGDGLQVRDWIHVDDHAAGILAVLERGRAGEVYHLGAGCELPNIEVVRALLQRLGKPESLITHVADRPGHDRRYAMDCRKAAGELGWAPARPFVEGLADTIAWYCANAAWVDGVRSGAYRDYYARMYGGREGWVRSHSAATSRAEP
jgi:dTDP-glucose 4,6-dehydratase